MKQRPSALWRTAVALLSVFMLHGPVHASALSDAEIDQLCRGAQGSAHCGILVEQTQLVRYPGVALRHDSVLEVSLLNGAIMRFADAEKNGPRDYSVWDVIASPPYLVLWVQEDETSHYLLINRETGHTFDMPGEPVWSPDQLHIASVDFCARGCSNEFALWAVLPQEVRKSSIYSPAPAWTDADVQWTGPDALRVATETDTLLSTGFLKRVQRTFDLKLDDKAWKSVAH